MTTYNESMNKALMAAHQDQVKETNPFAGTGQQVPPEEIDRRKRQLELDCAEARLRTERQQHEQRVWEMLNSVVRATYGMDRITAVEVIHWAEELVAKYEKRMKEQKE